MKNTLSQIGTGIVVIFGVLVAPAFTLLSFGSFGTWGAIAAVPFYYFVLSPILDVLTSRFFTLPQLPSLEALPKSLRRSLLLFASICHFAFLLAFILLWQSSSPQPIESFLLMLSLGWAQAGFGLVLAHDLVHERPQIFKLLGLVMFSSVGQSQQYWFHLLSHHRWVGSERDASTAPVGLSFYGFLARQPFAVFHKAICDMKGFKRVQRGAWIVVLNLVLVAVLALTASQEMAFWYFVSNLFVSLTFEAFNYVTHYGCLGAAAPKAWSCSLFFSKWSTLGHANHIEHHGGHRPGTVELTIPCNIHWMMAISLVPALYMHVANDKFQVETDFVSHA